VKTIRRAIGALTLACLFTAGLRLRGRGGIPPERGGWRELTRPKP